MHQKACISEWSIRVSDWSSIYGFQLNVPFISFWYHWQPSYHTLTSVYFEFSHILFLDVRCLALELELFPKLMPLTDTVLITAYISASVIEQHFIFSDVLDVLVCMSTVVLSCGICLAQLWKIFANPLPRTNWIIVTVIFTDIQSILYTFHIFSLTYLYLVQFTKD